MRKLKHITISSLFNVYLICVLAQSVMLLLYLYIEAYPLNTEDLRWAPLIVIVYLVFIIVLFSPLTTVTLVVASEIVKNDKWKRNIWNILLVCFLMISLLNAIICLITYCNTIGLLPRYMRDNIKWLIVLHCIPSCIVTVLLIILIEFLKKKYNFFRKTNPYNTTQTRAE